MPPRRKRPAEKKDASSDAKQDLDPTKLKVSELKSELGQRGLDTSGKKAELVERLQEAIEGGEPSSKKKKKEEEEMTDIGKMVSALKAEAKKSKKQAKQHKVDTHAPFASSYQVVGDYDCMLNQTNIGQNNNKFYVIQMLQTPGHPLYRVWTRWGRVVSCCHGNTCEFVDGVHSQE